MTSSATKGVVLTTGANSGIGLATVLEMARRGYRSIGTVRSPEKAAHVSVVAAAKGLEVETLVLDVTDESRCGEALGGLRLHALVNNAGFSVTGAIEDVGGDEIRTLLETAVLAPMRLACLALPAMRDAGSGRIVNVSSLLGYSTLPLFGWYGAAKHALEAATDSLRMEMAGKGVRVIIVEPGGILTSFWSGIEHDLAARGGSTYAQAYARLHKMLRLWQAVIADPARVAKVVADAIEARSPRARYRVGIDAHGMALVERMVPTPVLDRGLQLMFGLGWRAVRRGAPQR